MENRITKKVDTLVGQFKDDVKNWLDVNNIEISGNSNKSDFLKFIFDHNTIALSQDDFQRRKRVKNDVPSIIRCCAKRANGEQCTRRKKDECEFCGTHSKGTPYGMVDGEQANTSTVKKCEVWVQEIKGIQYFIDDNYNVYNHEDILQNKTTPEVIGNYVKNGEEYSVPQFENN